MAFFRALLVLSLCLLVLLVPAAQAASAPRSSIPARQIDGLLRTATLDLQELATLPSVQGAGSAAQCNRDVVSRSNVRYTTVGAANLAGDLYCLTPASAVVSIADRAYFLRTLGTNGLGVGDYQVGRATGVTALGLGYPIVDANKKVTGVVIAPLSLSFLAGFLTPKADRRARDTLVLDDHGTVLTRFGEKAARTGTNLGNDRLVKAMLTDDDGGGGFGGLSYNWTTVPLSRGAVHVAVGSTPRRR